MTVAGYPRYESYKDSGVEWIGEIPASWAVLRGKWLFIKQDRPVRSNDEIVTCFRDGEVTLRRNRRTDGFTTALKEHGYQGIRQGDLVIHAMDAFAGAIGVSDSDGKSTPVYSACTPRKKNSVNPYFYAYYMRHIALSGLLVSLAKGIRERSTDFRFNDFADLELAVPTLTEQNAIAAFLDEKCAKIDEAIRIKEEQIKLLHERRQILIQQAVTRGLNPDVPMKDSGIDWIGQIPAHWEIKRIKHIFHKIQTGTTPPTSNDRYFHGEINWYTPPDFQSETLVNSSRKISSLAIKNKEVKLFPKNSILVIGIGATSGKTAFMEDSGTFNQQITGFHTYTGHGKYFYYLFSTISPMVLALANYTTLPILNNEFFKGLLLPKPPVCEQKEIDRYVSELSDKIKKSAAVKQQQITTLKEYKTTLINAAVTGKIRITPDMLPTTTE